MKRRKAPDKRGKILLFHYVNKNSTEDVQEEYSLH